MVDLASQADVEKQLGRTLTAGEVARLPGLLAKASVIVEGYLGVTYTDADDVPAAVTIVVASMVARVFATSGTVTPGVTSEMVTAGPHQWQRSFSEGTNSVEPWMTKADRTALQGIGGGSMVSIPLRSERA